MERSNEPPDLRVQPAKALRIARDNWLVLGLISSIAAAWLWPKPGSPGGWMHAEITTKVGIALVFWLQGATLPLGSLLSGAKNLRLHALIQGVTFLIMPLLGLVGDLALGSLVHRELRVGFLYLCVLPSTIKTAVVFTSLAGGNSAAAIFSATLSSLIGVLATPLWIEWLTRSSPIHVPLGGVVAQIVGLLVAPFVVGLMSQGWLSHRTMRLKNLSNPIGSVVVLFIVYAAFCDSISSGTWRDQNPMLSLSALLLAAGLFCVASGFTWLGAKALRLSEDDTITALFCAPQKTLASGAPLAQLVFLGQNVGLLLLPLLFYHPLQLLMGGVLVSKLGRRKRPRDAAACA